MSSAKSRSPSDSVNVHMIPLLTPMSVLFIIQSIARRNRNEDIYIYIYIYAPLFDTTLGVKLFC